MFYRVVFIFDILVLLVLGYFYIDAMKYSGPGASSAIWVLILAVPSLIVIAAAMLRAKGRNRLASAVLLIVAVPALIFVLFFGLLLAMNPRWQ
jgi:hypothetical protein